MAEENNNLDIGVILPDQTLTRSKISRSWLPVRNQLQRPQLPEWHLSHRARKDGPTGIAVRSLRGRIALLWESLQFLYDAATADHIKRNSRKVG